MKFLQQKLFLLFLASMFTVAFTRAQVNLKVKNDSVFVKNSSGNTIFSVDTSAVKVNNKLGIGTNAPTATLHIAGTANRVQQLIKLPSSQTQANPAIQIQDNAGDTIFEMRPQFVSSGNNLYMGRRSGLNSATNNSIGIGDSTLCASGFTGVDNISIGNGAGKAITIGNDNISIGNQANNRNSNQSNNVAIGSFALQSAKTSSTVAIGYSALKNMANNTSATVAVGYQAGFGDTTGSNNTFIGYGAGATSNTYSSVFIGYYAGNFANVGNSKLLIANTNSTFPLIYGEFNNNILATPGKLGVGTQSPTSTLTVSGSLSGGYKSITAARTLDITDYIVNCTANSFTVTLPSAIGITGRQYIIKNTGSATTITIATTSSQTVDGSAPGTVTTLAPYRVVSDGANWITF